MKRIILFLAILSVGFISSCSKDEDNNNSTPAQENVFTAKVNGVQKNFTVSNVAVFEYPEYTDVEITAQFGSNPADTFELNLTRDNGEVYFVQYQQTGNYYQPSALEAFPVVIGENSATKLNGTFSGTLQDTGNQLAPVTITDGNFEVYFE